MTKTADDLVVEEVSVPILGIRAYRSISLHSSGAMNSGMRWEVRDLGFLDSSFEPGAVRAGFWLTASVARNPAALPLFEFQIASGGM